MDRKVTKQEEVYWKSRMLDHVENAFKNAQHYLGKVTENADHIKLNTEKISSTLTAIAETFEKLRLEISQAEVRNEYRA